MERERSTGVEALASDSAYASTSRGWLPHEGDVVALWLESEQLSVTVEVEDEASRVVLKAFRDTTELSSDPAAHFFAFKRQDYLGFKSCRTGKFLQARRRSPHRLGTFSNLWGVWEQFRIKRSSRVVSSKVKGWKSAILYLQPRQLPTVVISVGVYFVSNTAFPVPQSLPLSRGSEQSLSGRDPRDVEAFALPLKLMQGFIKGFARKRLRSSVSLRFTLWRNLVRRRKFQDRASSSISKKHARITSLSVLRAWGRTAAKINRQNHFVRRSRRQHHSRRTRLVFKEWENYLLRKRGNKANAQKCKRKLELYKKKRIIRAWALNHRNQAYLRRVVDHRITMKKDKQLRSMLHKWRANTEKRKQKHHRIRLIQKVMTRSRMHHSFDHWSELVQECAEVRLKLQRCIVRMSMKHMYKAFDAWFAYMSDQKRMRRVCVSQAFDTWWLNVDY